eukprot:5493896-Prymnesium_polylepis.2
MGTRPICPQWGTNVRSADLRNPQVGAPLRLPGSPLIRERRCARSLSGRAKRASWPSRHATHLRCPPSP